MMSTRPPPALCVYSLKQGLPTDVSLLAGGASRRGRESGTVGPTTVARRPAVSNIMISRRRLLGLWAMRSANWGISIIMCSLLCWKVARGGEAQLKGGLLASNAFFTNLNINIRGYDSSRRSFNPSQLPTTSAPTACPAKDPPTSSALVRPSKNCLRDIRTSRTAPP